MAANVADQTRAIQAAQYVRMSTDMQKYSTENQIAAIATYAARRHIDIVKTYIDAGKSGLTIKYRHGLQQLIKDVRAARSGFQMILVYDVSRWGRFQDADESAYYEFLCREAGISIRYCAEEFENDGSLTATVLKAIKRAMAAEYSRELSSRVFTGKCRMTLRGFHAGGRAGYGLRRMLLDEHGHAKSLLQEGERKFLHTDRTILVPGPPEEVQTVRWIFGEFVSGRENIASIVRSLNARGILNGHGGRWQKTSVRAVLTNEKYIGNSVFNRSSIRLKSKRVSIPQEQWIRAHGAYTPIVEDDVFLAAQARLSDNLVRLSRNELLDNLTALWCKHGTLSCRLINTAPACPRHASFRRLFGSLLEAFELVGYRHGSRRPIYASVERNIADTIIAKVKAKGGDAQRLGRKRRQNYVLINGELIVSIHLAYTRYRDLAGKPRFMLRAGAPIQSDIAILVPFDRTGHKIRDYYTLPRFLLTNTEQYIFDFNPIEIEAFRSASLEPLIDLLERKDIVNVSIRHTTGATRPRFPSLKPLHFGGGADRARPTRMLRNFERLSRRVVAFTSRCNRLAEAQLVMQQDLACLLSNTALRRLIQDVGLRTMPLAVHQWLTCGRMERDYGPDISAANTLPLLQEYGYQFAPERSKRIRDMRIAFADPSRAFAKLLIAASRPDEVVVMPHQRCLLSRGDAAHIQKRFRPIEEAAHSALAGFKERTLCYALARAFARSLLNNAQIADYIRTVHPRNYRRLILTPL